MMPAMCSFSFAVGAIGCASRYSRWVTSVAASRASSASNNPSLLPKWYFTSAELTPDFCAMSLSETSIELRSIMSSLAATSSLSAVLLRGAGSFVAAVVLGCGAIGDPENWPAVSACDGCTQELIERLTKLAGSRKSRATYQHPSAKIRGIAHGRGLYRRRRTHRRRPQ